jgi:hypothetical protein
VVKEKRVYVFANFGLIVANSKANFFWVGRGKTDSFYKFTMHRGTFKIPTFCQRWWLTLVILATWETEIRRIMVQGQPVQIVHETLSPK